MDSELQVFGFDLNRPTRALEDTLAVWKDLASTNGEEICKWMMMSGVKQEPVLVAANGLPLESPRNKSPRSVNRLVKLKSSASTSATFAETHAESVDLIRNVEAKVKKLQDAVRHLEVLKHQEQVDLAASSNSSLGLSSLATSGSLTSRLVRSATVGELHSAGSGVDVRDIEYEPLSSFSNKPAIKSATTERLISLMVTQDGDADLRRNVILTYRMYISPVDLLGRLMLFYTSTPEFEDASDRVAQKMMSALESTRSGVVETVVMWAKLCPLDFSLESVRALLERFIALLVDTYADESAVQLFRGLMNSSASPGLTLSSGGPVELVQGSLMSITNLPIEQLAAQLFLLEWNIYSHIQASEFHKISKGFANAPTIAAMTEFFNRMCKFLVSQILREETYNPSGVATAIAAVISLGMACRAMHNWDLLMVCVATLSTTSVSRLSDAWAQLSREDAKKAEELTNMTKKNFKMLRESMTGSVSPSIPHVALFIRDLTSLDENPTYIVSNGHVNFFKIKTAGQIIWQVLRHRDVPPTISPVKRLQDWILYSDVLSDQEAYERSRAYKPHGGSNPAPQLAGLAGMRKNKARRSIILG
jgi:hypothetical protein